MTVTMTNSTVLSLTEIKDFIISSHSLQFEPLSVAERNDWIQQVLMRHKYLKCSKKDKTLIRKYIAKMTGLSKAQITRLIDEYKTRGTLKTKKHKRNSFENIYTKADIELLAKIDNLNERLSGAATKTIFKDEFNIFNNEKYVRLKDISVSHLYRLRGTPRYRENVKIFSKTKATKVNIGERRRPEPNGKPGYLCVDTVHQGDKDKEKGVYHINITDMATQFEFIGAVEAISERYMEKILKELLSQFPFKIIEFHSDNGSEYINKIVAKLLNNLLIKLTKSRPRHSNDNALAETKNGAIIRKHMGYMHIPKDKANLVNEFYNKYFNTYINYHRPSAFPKIKTDKKGKERKYYPHDNYMTPYQKFKSLDNAEQYLKEGITFAELDKIACAMSHSEYAELMQKEKAELFKNIFS